MLCSGAGSDGRVKTKKRGVMEEQKKNEIKKDRERGLPKVFKGRGIL